MITIEEKAKAYDMALEAARKELGIDRNEWSVVDSVLKSIFPELKESEDEKILNAIIEHFRECNYTTISGIERIKILEWLVAQKNDYEFIPIENTLEYKAGFAAGKKEQKHAEWSEEDENALKYIHELISWGYAEKFMDAQTAHDMRKWVNEHISRDTFQNGNSRWSEEDESILNNIIAYRYLNVDDLEWIKKLPKRFNLQPKQEWSDEDEKMLSSIIMFLAGFMGNEEKIDFLKSFRPQSQGVYKQTVDKIRETIDRYEHNEVELFTYERLVDLLGNIKADVHIADECHEILDEPHWKPSEEQMGHLRYYVESGSECLRSLYNDLKKLCQ